MYYIYREAADVHGEERILIDLAHSHKYARGIHQHAIDNQDGQPAVQIEKEAEMLVKQTIRLLKQE